MKNDKLELLSLSSNFNICKTGNVYQISHAHSNVMAEIDAGEITYFVSGVYNNSSNFEEIDMSALKELKDFCELMIKE